MALVASADDDGDGEESEQAQTESEAEDGTLSSMGLSRRSKLTAISEYFIDTAHHVATVGHQIGHQVADRVVQTGVVPNEEDVKAAVAEMGHVTVAATAAAAADGAHDSEGGEELPTALSPSSRTAAGGPPRSSLFAVTQAWNSTLPTALLLPNDGGGPPQEGQPTGSAAGCSAAGCSVSGSGGGATEELGVGPLLDALQQALTIFDLLGPMMAPAVKNDLANCAKVRTAWEALGRPASLRGLLEAEVASGIHKPARARGEARSLKDPSAAIALVWVRRSVAFQTAVLGAMADDRDATLSSLAAEAYKSHLERYHTWILKSTFRMGLNAMPGRAEFVQRLAGEALSELDDATERARVVYEDASELAAVQSRLVGAIGKLLVDLELEAPTR